MGSAGKRDDPAGHRRRRPEERGRKRKAEAELGPVRPCASLRSPAERVPSGQSLVTDAADQKTSVRLAMEIVGFLDRTFCTSIILEKCVDEMVENGVIPVLPALVKHSEAPPSGEGDRREKFRRLEVQKTSEALGSLAVERERQHDSDNHDAISYLLYLLKRHEACFSSPSANGLIVRATKAVTELVLGIGNGSADILVRMGGGIPLLVELLDANDIYVQGAAVARGVKNRNKNRTEPN